MSLALIPNLLTLSRVVFTPLIVLTVVRGDYAPALWLLLGVGLTDAVDGWLARRFRWTSRAGAYLDPVADKILLSGVYIALGLAGAVPWWLVGIIFGRDAAILAGAGLLFAVTGRRSFPPSVWGKASTFVQIVTALTVLTALAIPGLPVGVILEMLIWLTGAAALASGADYLWRALRPAESSPAR